jgi:ABC-type amino acid transport substrate-binding protein
MRFAERSGFSDFWTGNYDPTIRHLRFSDMYLEFGDFSLDNPSDAHVTDAYAQSFGKGEWDIVIGVRSSLADPTPDFMVADAMYIAAPGREFANATGIDSAGVRVGVARGGGSDRLLSQALKSAQVVRVPGGVANAVEALRTGAVDVWAANPVTLQEIADALPGSKVVPGAWTTGRYAASLPEGKSVVAQGKLAEIVNEAKRSGVVERSIERAGFKGVRVAPE